MYYNISWNHAIIVVKVYGGITLDEMERQLGEIDLLDEILKELEKETEG